MNARMETAMTATAPLPDTSLPDSPTLADVGSTKSRVLSIQVLRGFAAGAVVLYHTDIILGHRNYGTNSQFGGLAEWGWLGVNLFFMISGFTIFLAHHRDIGIPQRLARYTWRRFVRVYPIYWLMAVAFLAATHFKSDYRALDIRPGNLMTAVTLLPFVQDPELPLKVAWSMLFEVMFYGLFALAILNRRLSQLIWPLWTVAILVSVFVFRRYALDPLNVYNLYFILGAMLWWATPKLRASALVPLMLGLGISCFAVSSVVGPRANFDHNNLALFALALPILLALAICIVAEKAFPRLFSAPMLLLLGDASYSIYLVHSAVLSVAGALQSRILVWIPGIVYFIAAGVGSVLVGILVHIYLERPILTRLRDRFAGGRPA